MDYQLILRTMESVPSFEHIFTSGSHQMASAYSRKTLEIMGRSATWLLGAELFEANSGKFVAAFRVQQIAKVVEEASVS